MLTCLPVVNREPRKSKRRTDQYAPAQIQHDDVNLWHPWHLKLWSHLPRATHSPWQALLHHWFRYVEAKCALCKIIRYYVQEQET